LEGGCIGAVGAALEVVTLLPDWETTLRPQAQRRRSNRGSRVMARKNIAKTLS
jgi:hypothetical protein